MDRELGFFVASRFDTMQTVKPIVAANTVLTDRNNCAIESTGLRKP